MDPKELKAQINYYLKTEASGSLMINAPWGSGKTYFIKEFLKEFAQNSKSKSLYVSLNGVRNHLEISERLIGEVISDSLKGKDALQKGFGTISNIWKSVKTIPFLEKYLPNSKFIEGYIIAWIKKQLTNSLVVFDDLERIYPESLIGIIGYIQNTFIENRIAKVVLLINESEIKSREEYFRIKEKTIIVTYNLRSQVNAFVQKKYDSYRVDNNFNRIASSVNSDDFSSIIQEFEIRNIRTVEYILYLVELLFLKKNQQLEESIDTEFIRYLSFLCFLYKSGHISKLGEFEEIGEKYYSELFKQTDRKGTERNKAEGIYLLINTKGWFSFFNLINEFEEKLVISGFVSDKDIEQYLARRSENSLSEHLQKHRELLNHRNLSETEFCHVLSIVMKAARKGLYEAELYPQLADLIQYFIDCEFVILRNWKIWISNGLRRSIELDNRELQTTRFDHMTFKSEYARYLFEEIRKFKEGKVQKYRNGRIRRLLEIMDFGNIEFSKIYDETSNFEMFNEDLETDIFNFLTTSIAQKLYAFISLLEERYLRIINIGEYRSSEISYIQNLIGKLKEFIKTQSIKKHSRQKGLLNMMMGKLSEVAIHLDKTRSRTI